MKDIKSIFSHYTGNNLNKKYSITISILSQKLTLYNKFEVDSEYTISSSKFGEGSKAGSYKTPLGAHYIKEYIGAGHDSLTIFQNRVPTKHKAKIISEKKTSKEDIICSRILWLSGLDEGQNKGPDIDSLSRYIYIHGTNEEGLLGVKASHGCIRMSNSDIIDLCDKEISNALIYISN